MLAKIKSILKIISVISFIRKILKPSKGESIMNGEKTFIQSKKWIAFIASLIIIAVSYFIGFKMGMGEAMINAMTTKMLYVALALILGQSGVDLAKQIMHLIGNIKLPVTDAPKTD